MIERLFLESRSKVWEDKRKWSLSPAGKRPSVIRRAGFYPGFFIWGEVDSSKGVRGHAAPENFEKIENIYPGHSGPKLHFLTTYLPCNDHFCVTTFCRVTTTFCRLLPLLWCANAVDFTNGFLPGLHNLVYPT